MSQNYYSEINLHLTWHTKNSDPLLTGEVEILTHRELRRRCVAEPGVFVHEIGGIETHVHLVVSIPPTLTISEFIGRLKGGTAYDVNARFGRSGKALEWQAGYGMVSFGTGDLEWVRAYARNQREHHARGGCHDRWNG
jgi:REP element-mobilizing transposase RayT